MKRDERAPKRNQGGALATCPPAEAGGTAKAHKTAARRGKA